ncbi:hypothetical protein N9L68_05305 [bacterium]|nr:hypothetical protein [bacterium]
MIMIMLMLIRITIISIIMIISIIRIIISIRIIRIRISISIRISIIISIIRIIIIISWSGLMYLVLLRRSRFFTSQRFHLGRARPPCLRGTVNTTTVCFKGFPGRLPPRAIAACYRANAAAALTRTMASAPGDSY